VVPGFIPRIDANQIVKNRIESQFFADTSVLGHRTIRAAILSVCT
jgi:hypothetical protein